VHQTTLADKLRYFLAFSSRRDAVHGRFRPFFADKSRTSLKPACTWCGRVRAKYAAPTSDRPCRTQPALQLLLFSPAIFRFDRQASSLYGVTTKRLNEQVWRNRTRFPEVFIFQLTSGKVEALRSRFATSNRGRGGRRYAPFPFTEQGVAM
jgi:hypothetical protein